MAAQIVARSEEGLPKMWLIHQALQLRWERRECFDAQAAYTPLAAEGTKSDYVIAYLRGDSVAVVVPRLTVKLGGAWRETTVTLPNGTWTNRMTKLRVGGGKVGIKDLLKDFPVALLVREDHSEGKSNA